MTKRRIMWLAVAVSLALAVGVLTWHVSRPYTFHRTNFERLRVGMARGEVEAVLGCPPGDYSTVAAQTVACGMPMGNRLSVGEIPEDLGELEGALWASDSWSGYVWFDKEGRITYAQCSGGWPEESPSLLSRLRAWLGW